jgi:nucleoside-diphosphate-sugar epimerase
MQAILGAGGAIGAELAAELTKYTDRIRLVGRNPKKVNDSDELFVADLTERDRVDLAVKGSEVVYLVAGLEYKTKIWRAEWPLIMRNVIDACRRHNAKLVFFDNIYMYDREYLNHMTEDTPIRPTSRKGEVRAQISDMLLAEVRSGNLTALIARAADFLGPKNSILVELVYKNFAKGRKANWFADAGKIHNFTFTPDAARATALLGNTADAYNQVWHLPTDRTPMTGREWIDLFAREMGVEPRFSVLSVRTLALLGLFVPILREVGEMIYQYDRAYLFDSSKFEKRFALQPTAPEQGVRWIIERLNG